jgi:hypothetical protein
MLSRLESIKDSGNYYYESIYSNILIAGHDNDTEIYLRTGLTRNININSTKLCIISLLNTNHDIFDTMLECDICLGYYHSYSIDAYTICVNCSSNTCLIQKNKQLPFFNTINDINEDQLYQYMLITYDDKTLYFYEECKYHLSNNIETSKGYCRISFHNTHMRILSLSEFNEANSNEYLKRYLLNKFAAISLIDVVVLDVVRIIGKFMIDITLREMM